MLLVVDATVALQVAESDESETLPNVRYIPLVVSGSEATKAPPGPPLVWCRIPAKVKDSSGEPDGRNAHVRFYEGRR